MVNQKSLGRILFDIQKGITAPLPPAPEPEDETPMQVNLLKTILLPIFENGVQYYFVNDINAPNEQKIYYRIKNIPTKGTGLEYNLSYKEYYDLELTNFIFEMEESDKRVNYTFTVSDYACYFKNVEAGELPGPAGGDNIPYYQVNYNNYGYKGNNKITDDNNGTIHHVRFITDPAQPSEDYDPSEDKNNVYEAFTEGIEMGDYQYEVVDDGSQRKIIIYYDTSKGQTEESAKNANVEIFVKKVTISDLENTPQKGTSDYYYMFYAYEIEYANRNNNSSIQEQSDIEPEPNNP